MGRHAANRASGGAESKRPHGGGPGIGRALNNIGWYYSLLGDREQALAYCSEALGLFKELRAGYAEGVIYGHLGDICLARGDREEARAQWQQAVNVFDQLGRSDAAQVRAKLAELDSPAPVH